MHRFRRFLRLRPQIRLSKVPPTHRNSNPQYDWQELATWRQERVLWMYGPTALEDHQSPKKSPVCVTTRDCWQRYSFFFFFFFQVRRGTEHGETPHGHNRISDFLIDPRNSTLQASSLESESSFFSCPLETQLQTLIMNPLLQAYSLLGDKRAA